MYETLKFCNIYWYVQFPYIFIHKLYIGLQF